MSVPKRIPRKINVVGRIYKVKKVPESKMPDAEGPDEIHHGYCNSEKTEILILNNLSPEAQRGVLEHEVGHASSEESGARDIMSKFTTKHLELEEILCRVWLPAYLQTLRDKVK